MMPFNCRIIFHCADGLPSVYPLPRQRGTGDRFHFRAVVDRATMHICIKSLHGHMFPFVSVLLGSGVTGSHSKVTFNIARNYQSGHTILLSHQQCRRVGITPYLHQYFILYCQDFVVLCFVVWGDFFFFLLGVCVFKPF